MMGEKNNPALDISFALAVQLVKHSQEIQRNEKEYSLTKQLIRSCTSIGANLEEAVGGQSERDFLSKISIAYKEARETSYWLKLLKALEYISVEEHSEYQNELSKVKRILGSSIRTLKRKLAVKD